MHPDLLFLFSTSAPPLFLLLLPFSSSLPRYFCKLSPSSGLCAAFTVTVPVLEKVETEKGNGKENREDAQPIDKVSFPGKKCNYSYSIELLCMSCVGFFRNTFLSTMTCSHQSSMLVEYTGKDRVTTCADKEKLVNTQTTSRTLQLVFLNCLLLLLLFDSFTSCVILLFRCTNVSVS